MSDNSIIKHYYVVYGLDKSGYKYKLKIIADKIENAISYARMSGIIPKRVDELEQTRPTDYLGIISTDRLHYSEQW